MAFLVTVLPLLAAVRDKTPAPEDVTAGWVGFGVFLLLVLAVVLLGMSLVRHLRKARDNADMGFFDPSDKPRPRSS
jgi:hypothetical protein